MLSLLDKFLRVPSPPPTGCGELNEAELDNLIGKNLRVYCDGKWRRGVMQRVPNSNEYRIITQRQLLQKPEIIGLIFPKKDTESFSEFGGHMSSYRGDLIITGEFYRRPVN